MSFDFLMSPLISLAVRKAGDSLIQQFCQMHGMNRNCEKLHRQLLAIQAVMENAEHHRNEPNVHEWLKKLRAIAYRAVDVLDEFQYEALRWKALHQNPFPSRIKKAMKCVTLHWNSILFRHEMSKKLENVLEKVNEVLTEMRNLSFVPIVNPQPAINKPPTYSWIIESDIIGRDGEKDIIINKLIDPIREMENISVLPIIGMGGAGKTTLAQLVYNEEKVKEHFKLRMWICVSTEFNIANIMKSMIEVATNRECMPTSNLEVLQKRLHEILSVNKFLLVLDDVWNEEIEKWDSLKTLLFSVSYSGSVIIVTTRSKRVGSLMGTLTPHDLAMLSDENSWKLFRMRAFGDGEEPPELLEIGRIIVEKCAGLPLALKVLGALMNTKREVHEWQAISENIIWDGEASAKEVLPALKLSYDHLPSYIKQCFTFCAMFPRDYEIQSEELIQLWMANDFIPDDGIMDLEEKGQSIFDELCLRCFFHDIRVREQHGAPWRKSTYYRRKRITYCKMHDLMHDLAKYIGESNVLLCLVEVMRFFIY